MKLQYHLTGRGHSNRGVRIEPVDPDFAGKNLTDAARLAGMDATPIEIKKTEWRNGIKLMIVSFTEPCANPNAEGTKWMKSNPQVLENIGTYFTPKDVAVLEALYRDYHDVNEAELDAITGKAIPVASED